MLLAISLTSLANGIFLMSNSVLFWYFRISRSATVPGLNLCFFLPAQCLIAIHPRFQGWVSRVSGGTRPSLPHLYLRFPSELGTSPVADHHVPDVPAFDPAFPACISSFSYGVRSRSRGDRKRQLFSLRARVYVTHGLRCAAKSTGHSMTHPISHARSRGFAVCLPANCRLVRVPVSRGIPVPDASRPSSVVMLHVHQSIFRGRRTFEGWWDPSPSSRTFLWCAVRAMLSSLGFPSSRPSPSSHARGNAFLSPRVPHTRCFLHAWTCCFFFVATVSFARVVRTLRARGSSPSPPMASRAVVSFA